MRMVHCNVGMVGEVGFSDSAGSESGEAVYALARWLARSKRIGMSRDEAAVGFEREFGVEFPGEMWDLMPGPGAY